MIDAKEEHEVTPTGAWARAGSPWLLTLVVALYALVFLLAQTAGFVETSGQIAVSLALGALLVALTLKDIEEMRLPDLLTLSLAAMGIALAGTEGTNALYWSCASGAIGLAGFWLIARAFRHLRGRDGLGMGDAKLLGAGGTLVGAEALAPVVFVAATSALVFVLVKGWLGTGFPLNEKLPFGPFIAAAIWIAWLYPIAP